MFKLGEVPSDKMAGTPVSGELLVTVILPELVTGEPETDIPVPAVIPTLVTVPEPVPAPISLLTSAPVLKSTLPDESLTKNWSVSVPAFDIDGILYAPADEINCVPPPVPDVGFINKPSLNSNLPSARTESVVWSLSKINALPLP